jgi:hypothetical protein
MRLATIRTADGRTRAVRVDAEDDDLGQAALVSRPGRIRSACTAH